MTLGVCRSRAICCGRRWSSVRGRVSEDSIHGVLHQECSRLLPDEVFADLFTDVGRRSVPPMIVATLALLNGFDLDEATGKVAALLATFSARTSLRRRRELRDRAGHRSRSGHLHREPRDRAGARPLPAYSTATRHISLSIPTARSSSTPSSRPGNAGSCARGGYRDRRR